MSALPQPDSYPQRMTEAEYLAFERDSEIRHEYCGGEVFAMTGASRNHNQISGAACAAPRIERFVRQGEVWLFSEAKGLDATLQLDSIGCPLALAEVYEQVTFASEDDDTP